MNTASANKDILVKALGKLLKPICRLCVRNSVKLLDVVEILKASFVEAASEEIRTQGQTLSGSKISIMSGVHRKDVVRIQSEGVSLKSDKNIIAKVMVRWQHDKKYRTKVGEPRVLDAEGRNSEFATLVESVTGGDLGAYALLFEMERIGAIQKQGKKVKLIWRDYVSSGDAAEGFDMLAGDAEDLITAVEENIYSNPKVPNLHLKTEFDNVSRESLPAIREWLLSEGSLFHKRVREYLSQFDQDLNPKLKGARAGARVVFGAFSRISKEIA